MRKALLVTTLALMAVQVAHAARSLPPGVFLLEGMGQSPDGFLLRVGARRRLARE